MAFLILFFYKAVAPLGQIAVLNVICKLLALQVQTLCNRVVPTGQRMFLMMFFLQSGSPSGADSDVLNIIRKL
jgi:hypothetical protein